MELGTSADSSAKKVPLEDLSKEELVKKCRGLLNIAQKAKQVKDAITEENQALKNKLEEQQIATNGAAEVMIETLTNQKLSLTTTVEELKHQNNLLNSKLVANEKQLIEVLNKTNQLEIENQGLSRQVTRLTDENEDLLRNLDELEKQLGLLKAEKDAQLSKFEASYDSEKSEFVELQKMLRISLDEVKSLQADRSDLQQQLHSVNEIVAGLQVNIKKLEESNTNYKKEVDAKSKMIEKYVNSTDDLNVELHKNRAIIEKLKQDLANTNAKLSESQIICSGVATDLQHSNDKLREKLKFYHAKLVKFAADVKLLKQDKATLIVHFKEYNDHVVSWKTKLETFSLKVSDEFNRLNEDRQRYKAECDILRQQISNEDNVCNKELEEQLSESVKQVTNLKDNLEKLAIENDTLNGKLNASEMRSQTDIEDLKKLVEKVESDKLVLKEHLNESVKQVDTLRSNLEKLVSENEKLKLNDADKNEEISTLESLVQKLEDGKIALEKELNQLKALQVQEKKQAEETIELLKAELKSKESVESNLKDLIAGSQQKLNGLEETVKEVSYQIEVLKEKEEQLKAECDQAKKELQTYEQDPILKLAQKIEENVNLCKMFEELQKRNWGEQNCVILMGDNSFSISEIEPKEVKQLKLTVDSLKESRPTEQSIHSVDVSDTLVQTEEDTVQFSHLKKENSELLAAMNEMNQVLRERGETISNQQAYCDELMKKLQIYETKNNDSKEGSTTTLQEKDEEIKRLHTELEVMKEKITKSMSEDTGYAESETMSTSTFSRTEELNRLKDLEGSWEERYGKLRTLAIKLKGKIRDLTAELSKEQEEKSEIQQKLSTSIKTVQSLQSKCDTLEDDLEVSREECKRYSKRFEEVANNIGKDKQNLATNEEVISKLKAEIDELNKNKAGIENWKKQVSAKVQTLKKELEASAVVKKDFEARIAALQSELEAKDQALKTEIERHKQTKNSLEESNNECKKKSVLSLEMQDYERSVKDLSQKLENKQELITQLRNQIDSQKSTISALREQNTLLEGRAEQQETEINNIKAETNILNKKINELEDSLTQKDDKILVLTRNLEDSRLENEELSTELAKVIAEHQKTNANLKSEKDHLRSRNLGLEQKLREVQDILKLKEHELDALQTEHQAYKVRAQSVLRQNQTRDFGLEEKLNQELSSCKAQMTNLTEKLEKYTIEVKQLTVENQQLKKELVSIGEVHCELQQSMEEQVKEYNQLKMKYELAQAENAETVRNMKLHAETLAQCYRQQLSEQEVRHNKEIVELQSKVAKPPSPTELTVPLPPMTNREEGEGSESVDSCSFAGLQHPLSFERLINTDMAYEVDSVRKQLAENESKVAHLTDLLADTEQDLAKHVQMNKLLKEEIRRQQRSVEREMHAENLEYLKNIVFKFLTLSSGDERLRLVPVLNTILKLSPEETNKLNLVAKGERGWTNYLNIPWSSPNRPQ